MQALSLTSSSQHSPNYLRPFLKLTLNSTLINTASNIYILNLTTSWHPNPKSEPPSSFVPSYWFPCCLTSILQLTARVIFSKYKSDVITTLHKIPKWSLITRKIPNCSPCSQVPNNLVNHHLTPLTFHP